MICKLSITAFFTLSFSLVIFADELYDRFVSPRREYAPQTWWHWMNGNVTKEGITADLEAMAWAGLSGAHIFDVHCDIPEGPVKFGSESWYEMLEHANLQAQRLGLELTLANCSGFSSSGGPWVEPEDSMKVVTYSEKFIRGGGKIEVDLPLPMIKENFYRDICTLAIPAVNGEQFPTLEPEVKIHERILDSLYVKSFEFPKKSAASQLQIRFDGPLNKSWNETCSLTIKASNDGEVYKTVLEQPHYKLRVGKQAELQTRYIDFDQEVEAKYFRIIVDFKGLEKNSFRVVSSDIGLVRRVDFPTLSEHLVYSRTGRGITSDISAEDCVIEKYKVMDLTRFSKDGVLSCCLPDGDWQIFRFGYTSTGVKNHPATKFGSGLESDKLSAAAISRFFDGYLGKVLKRIGPRAKTGKGINAVLIDSYEVGCQNWTDGFEKEFLRKSGYEITPYMLLFAGKIINSIDETKQFLQDFRNTVSELFVENYAGEMKRRLKEHSLKLVIEPYGSHPADDQLYGSVADEPMWEFWSSDTPKPMYTHAQNVYPVASIGHIFGQRKIAAESFTTSTEVKGWSHDIFSYKGRGDEAYAAGVNKVVYHRWAHQPWVKNDCLPGMTMGPWGTWFERTQTWWRYVRPWIKYQTRAQYLLQEGRICRDILLFTGSTTPNYGGWTNACTVNEDPVIELSKNYGIDSACGSILGSFKMVNGLLVAPSGVKYSHLIVNPAQYCSKKDFDLISKWRDEGLVVVQETPTLEVLESYGLKPDFTSSKEIRYIHRKYTDGTDGYFVAWPGEEEVEEECSFRITGRNVELWDMESGRVFDAVNVREKDGRTFVKISFPPKGSFFVMFRPLPTETAQSNEVFEERNGEEIKGPWIIEFPIDWYTGGERKEKIQMNSLFDWSKFADPNIKYFSGSATYKTTIKCDVQRGERAILSLGDVKNVAEVTVNGRTYDALWRRPYKLDITDSLSPDGEASVIIKVANLWPNRIIGDEKVAPEKKWVKTKYGEVASELPIFENPKREGRVTFASWRYWRADDALLPSGLIGPVKLSIQAPRRFSR